MRYNKKNLLNFVLRGIKIKCQACDCNLSDYESVRKDQHGEYVDLCGKCYQHTKDENLLIETDRFFFVDRYEN